MIEVFEPRPAEGLNYPNAVQMVAARCRRTPQAPALRHKRDGAWQTCTWEEWWETARALAAGLREVLGVDEGRAVAIASPTRVEWLFLDLAISMAGAVSVPLHPELTPEEREHVLRDSGCSVILADVPWSSEEAGGEDVRWVALDGAGSRDGATTYAELERLGREALPRHEGALDEIAARLRPSDPFTIVYTSGATGVPKGVVLTHRNIVYESWAIKNVIPADESDEQLLVLPLAHIFARHLVWGAVEQGVITAVGEPESRLLDNLVEIAPSYVGLVPRVLDRLLERVRSEMTGSGPLAARAFALALEVGMEASRHQQRGEALPTSLAMRLAVADAMYFSRARALFGGRLRFLVSGGAALPREVAEFFHACSILVLEGYGLTETSGATNVNRPDRYRFGTVGPAMPGCEIYVAEDGEVMVRGHNVMARYHNLPEETAAAFDEHGFFRTGDLGELRDGFLRITDRKKNLFKTNHGAYVAPRPIEAKLARKPEIAHAVVFGEGRPYAAALIELDEEAARRLAEREGLPCRTYAELAAHPRVRQVIQLHLDQVNADLPRHQVVARFLIAPTPFSVATGELTATGKVRRRHVLASHASALEALYEPRSGLGSRPRVG